MKYISSAKVIAMTTLRKLLAGASVVIVSVMTIAGCDREKPAGEIKVTARPGAVVIVPYDQPVRGKRQRAMGYISARSSIDPRPLPQGAEIIYESLGLHGSGDIAGDLLIMVPQDAEGDIKFSLSASGQGNRALGGSASFFSTEDIDVTIKIAGDPAEDELPDLAGEWSNDEQSWTFRHGHLLEIDKRRAHGEETASKFHAYSDGNGRWFLVELGGREVFWIEYENPGKLSISSPDAAFDPFTSFVRISNE